MPETPSDTLEVKFAGEPKELFMSFALLSAINAEVRDLPDVQRIALDLDLRSKVLAAVFAERDASGRVAKEVDPAYLPMSPRDVLRVTKWVQEHILDFLLGALETSVQAAKPHEERLKTLLPYGDGSPG